MGKEIEEQISKLEEKKKSLELKKKLLLEKERQKKVRLKSKRFSEIGKIASKAGIDSLDDSTLFGAFLEIKSLLWNDEKISSWKSSGESYLGKENSDSQTPLSISFKGDVGQKEKKAMKSLGFRFNKFRNEFYGYGTEENIRKELNGFDYKIEKLES